MTRARPLALFAGGGEFPLILFDALKAAGHEVVVVGFRGETGPAIRRRARRYFEGHVGGFEAIIAWLKREGATEAMMAGYVRHANIYRRPATDTLTGRIWGRLLDKRADTLLAAATLLLKRSGISLVSAMPYLAALIPEAGILTRRKPTAEHLADIEFGRRIAVAVAGQDIGQSVAVKDKAVVAVEALEGTDRMILRAGQLGGKGAVIVKVAKPRQDFRFDVPVIGLKTVASLKKAGASALAIEAGRTLLLRRAETIAAANKAGLVIIAV